MNQTDKEMLELAARAAGYEFVSTISGAWTEVKKPESQLCNRWNPLIDDGDALRLAVKLQLQILQFRNLVNVAHNSFGDGFTGCDERYDGDSCASTRRAIVRAAAKIGRTMKC